MVLVGRDIEDDLVPILCHGQKRLLLDHDARGPIQPGLEHFQGRSLHNFSEQPILVPHHHHGGEFLPASSLKPLPLVLSLDAFVECLSPAIL